MRRAYLDRPVGTASYRRIPAAALQSLVAVTASANRTKGDQDPAEWLPPLGQCRCVREWVAVKARWHLTVDAAEKRALTVRASKCPALAYCYRAIAAGYGHYIRGRDPEYAWYTDSDRDGRVCEEATRVPGGSLPTGVTGSDDGRVSNETATRSVDA